MVNVIKERYPDREIKVANAEGLRDCYKMLRDAVAGKYSGLSAGRYGLSRRLCCRRRDHAVHQEEPGWRFNLYAKQAKHKTSNETKHIKELEKLVD